MPCSLLRIRFYDGNLYASGIAPCGLTITTLQFTSTLLPSDVQEGLLLNRAIRQARAGVMADGSFTDRRVGNKQASQAGRPQLACLQFLTP